MTAREMFEKLGYEYSECWFESELDEIYYQKGDCCTWIVELRKQVSEKNKEIEQLNNIINMAITAINTYQDSKTLSIGYENLKRIKGILRGNDFDILMFEEYLKELKEKINNERKIL